MIAVVKRTGLHAALSVALCGGLLAQAPDFDPQAVYQEAEAAFREQHLDRALEGFLKLAEIRPDIAELQAKLGLIYYLGGKFSTAVPHFEKALKLKPDLANGRTLLAISLSEIGRYQEALPGLKSAFDDPPDEAIRKLAGLQLTRTYAALEKNSEAARIAARLSELYPDDPEVLFHAGRLYGDLAYANIRRLTLEAPDTVWGHQALAEAHESRGDHEVAIVEYRKVLAMEPGRPEVHFRIGQTMLARSPDPAKADDALAEYQKELEHNPGHSLAAYQAGEIVRQKGDLQQAQKYFEQALEYDAEFEHAHIALGRLLLQLREAAPAARHLEKATQINDREPVSHYHLALAYRALGRPEDQKRELETFRRLRAQKEAGQWAQPRGREVIEQSIDRLEPGIDGEDED